MNLLFLFEVIKLFGNRVYEEIVLCYYYMLMKMVIKFDVIIYYIYYFDLEIGKLKYGVMY